MLVIYIFFFFSQLPFKFVHQLFTEKGKLNNELILHFYITFIDNWKWAVTTKYGKGKERQEKDDSCLESRKCKYENEGYCIPQQYLLFQVNPGSKSIFPQKFCMQNFIYMYILNGNCKACSSQYLRLWWAFVFVSNITFNCWQLDLLFKHLKW